MTRDDVIRMARLAGLQLPCWEDWQDPKTDTPMSWAIVSACGTPLERFAALVAAAEREECAKLIYGSFPVDEYESPLNAIANAIRARGTHEA